MQTNIIGALRLVHHKSLTSTAGLRPKLASSVSGTVQGTRNNGCETGMFDPFMHSGCSRSSEIPRDAFSKLSRHINLKNDDYQQAAIEEQPRANPKPSILSKKAQTIPTSN